MRPKRKTISTADGFFTRLRNRGPFVYIPIYGLMTVACLLIFCAIAIALMPHLRTRANITDLIFHAFVFHAFVIGLSSGFFSWFIHCKPVETFHVTPRDF
jgi:hypothetical protein